MANFVPTYKRDTIAIRANMIGSITGGMFLGALVLKSFPH